MSFRKRNVGLASPPPNPDQHHPGSSTPTAPRSTSSLSLRTPNHISGVRPSPLDGRPTTSTGTQSLDDLLAGHAGLALGNSVLVEENGTTDFAGALLRYYAAEGVLQGHVVHVIGVGEQWGRELPGAIPQSANRGLKEEDGSAADRGKMKIAWRYERLGNFRAGASGLRASPISNQNVLAPSAGQPEGPATQSIFCHSFDLTKRLTIPLSNPINILPIPTVDHQTSPFTSIIQNLTQKLSASPPSTIHRLIIPNILSPPFYPPHASNPLHILQFLHSLRALLRLNPTQLTAMITLSLTLYPRSTGLVRWMEILSDGVLELAPFPHAAETGPSMTTSGAATAQEEKPQGMVKIHCLPVFHEKCGGGAGASGGDDLAFTVSRRRFTIKPFSLPPVEGDSDAQSGETVLGKTKVDIDF